VFVDEVLIVTFWSFATAVAVPGRAEVPGQVTVVCPHIPIGTARKVSSARAAVRIVNLLFILFVVVLGCLYLIDSKFNIQRFKDFNKRIYKVFRFIFSHLRWPSFEAAKIRNFRLNLGASFEKNPQIF
jgi:hypothetical protein